MSLNYNFSIGNKKLPKVSFQCLTYGRPYVLEEAIQSFILQDYIGPKEMVIVNDCVGMTLYLPDSISKLYNIKIINLSYRIPTIGDKRNFCCEHCTGDIIFPQDDDDISLPWRISTSIKYLQGRQHFKPTHYIKFKHGKIYGIQETRVGHNMSCMTKALWQRVRYESMQSGQDQRIESAFEKLRCRFTLNIPIRELFYIYKWDTGSYHLSAYGWNRGFNQVESYVSKESVQGNISLKPHWNYPYTELFLKFLERPNAVRTKTKLKRIIHRI